DRQLQLLSGGPASLSVIAAGHAFDQYDRFVAETPEAVRTRGPGGLAGRDAAGRRYERPAAGLTVEGRPPWPVGADGEAKVREAGMFLVPCDMYGAPGAYRISLLADPVALREAVALLAESSLGRGCGSSKHFHHWP